LTFPKLGVQVCSKWQRKDSGWLTISVYGHSTESSFPTHLDLYVVIVLRFHRFTTNSEIAATTNVRLSAPTATHPTNEKLRSNFQFQFQTSLFKSFYHQQITLRLHLPLELFIGIQNKNGMSSIVGCVDLPLAVHRKTNSLQEGISCKLLAREDPSFGEIRPANFFCSPVYHGFWLVAVSNSGTTPSSLYRKKFFFLSAVATPGVQTD